MRSKQQMVSKTPGGLAQEIKKFDTDIDGWRKETMPLASGDKEVVAECRANLKRKWKETAKITRKVDITRKLKLSKRRYKKWKRQWDSDDSDEMSAQWDELFDKQGLTRCRPMIK